VKGAGGVARLRICLILLGVCLAVSGCEGRSSPSDGVFLQDGFEGDFAPGVWGRGGECLVPGSFSFEEEFPRSGRAALAITVGPGTRPPCQDGRDKSERSEMWEASAHSLDYGAEVWYGFSFRISGEVSASNEKRLVIGQWKQSGGRSPIVAQRFKNRIFHISAESGSCRVLLAKAAGTLPDGNRYCRPEEVKLKILLSKELPDPFGRWVDMVYHLKSGPAGLVEVWANGQPVVRAAGLVGYPDDGKIQYFKFGPYRAPVPYVTTAHLDNFTRGGSFREVDPRRFGP
jgi:hypothetical protein